MSLLEIRDLRTEFKTHSGGGAAAWGSGGEAPGNRDGIVRAVDGVSFSLEKGRTLGIVGESGSGKSVSSLSILRLLGDNGRIAGGSILFEGRDLVSLDERAMRDVRGNAISMIFQDPMTSLNPFLTVERQITEVLEIHRRMPRSEARKKAAEGLSRAGIPDAERRLSQYPHQFSGGMRQRVMIAIALACEPKLLIADEPTTALDVTIQAQILDLIRDLQRQTGTSVILITHDLGVVAGMADEVAVMYAGRIVEHADAATLFHAPKHPYTRALLASIPKIEGPRERLAAIPGMPPDLSRIPAGCAFHPRCSRAIDTCKTQVPPLIEIGSRRLACPVEGAA